MRLTEKERNTISTQAKLCFGMDSSVMLFGSRVDDERKGGDIDLLVRGDWESNDGFQRKVDFLVALKTRLGDQHIDVVIAEQNDQRFIVKEAMRTGIRL